MKVIIHWLEIVLRTIDDPVSKSGPADLSPILLPIFLLPVKGKPVAILLIHGPCNGGCRGRTLSNQSYRNLRLYDHRFFCIAEPFLAGWASVTLTVVFDHFTGGRKRDGVYRFIVLLSRRMDPGKDTDRMLAGSQGTGLCYMVSFFINTFCLCAFRAIADDAKSFKLFSIWFYDITFVNKDNRIGWEEPFYSVEIRCSCRGRSSPLKGGLKVVLRYLPCGLFHEAGRKYP